MRWMKKGFWKRIEGHLWYYKGYRSDYGAAYNIIRSMRWDGSGLEGLRMFNESTEVYEIFVRPKQQ